MASEAKAMIGICIGSPKGPTDELASVLEEVFGEQPKRIEVVALAGPNDLLQLLARPEGWAMIAIGVFGKAYLSEAGKDAWKATGPFLQDAKQSTTKLFARLLTAIQDTLAANAVFVLGFPKTLPGTRSVGVVFEPPMIPEEGQPLDPNAIRRIVAVFGQHGPQISKRLDEWEQIVLAGNGFPVQSLCQSPQIFITDEGDVELRSATGDRVYKLFEQPRAPVPE